MCHVRNFFFSTSHITLLSQTISLKFHRVHIRQAKRQRHFHLIPSFTFDKSVASGYTFSLQAGREYTSQLPLFQKKKKEKDFKYPPRVYHLTLNVYKGSCLAVEL